VQRARYAAAVRAVIDRVHRGDHASNTCGCRRCWAPSRGGCAARGSAAPAQSGPAGAVPGHADDAAGGGALNSSRVAKKAACGAGRSRAARQSAASADRDVGTPTPRRVSSVSASRSCNGHQGRRAMAASTTANGNRGSLRRVAGYWISAPIVLPSNLNVRDRRRRRRSRVRRRAYGHRDRLRMTVSSTR